MVVGFLLIVSSDLDYGGLDVRITELKGLKTE